MDKHLTPWTQLEGLDFADDLALLSRSQQQLQEKTDRVSKISAQDGLKTKKKGQTKILKINTTNTHSATLEGKKLE